MMMNVEMIESEVLSLPLIDRERLFKKLLLSLESPSEKEIGQLWRIEIKKRLDAIYNGDAQMIPSEAADKEVIEFLNNCHV